MDTAMRDMDQLRERGDESTGRKVGLFAMAAVLSVAAVFAMGIMVGRDNSAAQSPAQDPLAQLVGAPSEQAVKAQAPDVVEPATLSFPSTLLQREDPAVEATVRAAAAEHAALTGRDLPPAAPPAVVAVPSAAPSAGDLAPIAPPPVPASTLATSDSDRLSRVARHDPLVAKALPREEEPAATAPAGSEGAYTLQVVSYDSAAQAERFAKTLRARGHKSFVMQADIPGRGRFHRVRIGPFEHRKDAVAYQRNFEDAEKMHTILISQPR